MSIYPITFSIPECKIITKKYIKKKFLSSLIPGDPSTYIYNTEKEYYDEYRKSFFAVTFKKSGWDCMRHYEIIANGCIPYFRDIEKCPPNTLYLFPKELIRKGNRLYEKSIKKKSIDLNEYDTLLNELLEYMHNHLTTKKMATYILSKLKLPVSNILYLSGDLDPDYLRCVTLHGFKELYGKNCHDYPKVPHLYHSKKSTKHLYGKGMTYSKLLDDSYHDDKKDLTILKDIQNHVYDIIIYGSYHRGMPFYDVIVKSNYKDNLIMLCGEDIHSCDYSHWVKKGHTLFVREL
jgi:hypothetical protein